MLQRNFDRRPHAMVAMAHPTRRTRLTAALRADGWTVNPLADGFALVRRLADVILTEDPTRGPDLLVVDATLSGCTGLTVLEGLRALRFQTPIIVIVDFNRPATLSLANELGATAVFEKPIDVAQVATTAAALRPLTPNRRRRAARARAAST